MDEKKKMEIVEEIIQRLKEESVPMYVKGETITNFPVGIGTKVFLE